MSLIDQKERLLDALKYCKNTILVTPKTDHMSLIPLVVMCITHAQADINLEFRRLTEYPLQLQIRAWMVCAKHSNNLQDQSRAWRKSIECAMKCDDYLLRCNCMFEISEWLYFEAGEREDAAELSNLAIFTLHEKQMELGGVRQAPVSINF